MVPRFEALALSFTYQGKVNYYWAAVIASNSADLSNTLMKVFTAATPSADMWDILER